MTHEQVLHHLCTTVGLVYKTIGDYTEASDGFCGQCTATMGGIRGFQHSGRTLKYVRQAVVEKLARDGYKPTLDPDDDEVMDRIADMLETE